MRKILVSLTTLLCLGIGLAACAAQPEPTEEISSDDAVSEDVVVSENVAESSEAISQCGVGLYCYWTPYKGTGACLNNGQTVHCCPLGFASAGGSCVPICGYGLSCGYSSLWPSGSNICTQNNGNQNPVYCCAPGKTFTPNGCL